MLDVGIYAVWGHRRVRCHLERGHAGQHRARFGSRYLDRHWPWVRRDDVWWGWSVVGHVVSVSTPDTVAPWPGSADGSDRRRHSARPGSRGLAGEPDHRPQREHSRRPHQHAGPRRHRPGRPVAAPCASHGARRRHAHPLGLDVVGGLAVQSAGHLIPQDRASMTRPLRCSRGLCRVVGHFGP